VQPRYSPLAMIPGLQQNASNHTRSNSYNNNNHRPTSFLDTTQRGGGERDEALNENLLPPSSSSNISSQSPTSFLDATQRGGGERDDALNEDLIPPSSSSSSISSQISTQAKIILQTITSSKKARGRRAILLLVAFLYGTLNVTLRAVYATEGPPAASVLSLVRQVLSIASFVPIFMASSSSSSSSLGGTEEGEEERQEQQQQQIDGAVVRPMWMSALELAFCTKILDSNLIICLPTNKN